jgi:outer membrane protein
MKQHSLAATFVAGATLLAGGSAHAQFAGQAMVKVGFNRIMPKVQSGDLTPPALPDSRINVEPANSAIISFAYMFTDNWSMEFLGGLPYKHDIVGAGSVAGVGKLGSIHQISPTAFLQYRFFQPTSVIRPYVGLGLTYAVFYDTEGSAALTAVTNPGGAPVTIGSDRSWGGSGEVGVSYAFNDQWFVDAAVIKTYISTTAPLSTGQSITAKLNPVSANLSLGYRF